MPWILFFYNFIVFLQNETEITIVTRLKNGNIFEIIRT